jgi:hypothetical protein
MFTLLCNYRLKDLASTELPSLMIALALAELFYKFHSFLLEAIAFFVTWLAVGWVLRLLFPTRWTSRPIKGERGQA